MRYTFSASRVTGGNVVFPDQFVIDENTQMLTYRKKKLIGYEEFCFAKRWFALL